jgi:hypothetical protein
MPVVRCSAVMQIAVVVLLSGSIPLFRSGALVFRAAAQTADIRMVGVPGELLPLHLNLPAQALAKGAGGTGERGLLRVGGVPPSCSMNHGFVAAGTWYVSLDDAKDLALSTPKDFGGNLILTIQLVQSRNPTPISWQIPITIGARGDASQRLTAAESLIPEPRSVAALPVPAILGPVDRAQMQRAQDLLRNNDVAAARLVLKRLADANIAEAAYELARTYDPDFLRTIQTSGSQADLAQAKKWYERAAQLGNRTASIRVNELRER